MEIRTTLRLDREAKNTVRYVETTFPQCFYSGMIYIRKDALGDQDYPPELEVTITPKAKLAVVRA